MFRVINNPAIIMVEDDRKADYLIPSARNRRGAGFEYSRLMRYFKHATGQTQSAVNALRCWWAGAWCACRGVREDFVRRPEWNGEYFSRIRIGFDFICSMTR